MAEHADHFEDAASELSGKEDQETLAQSLRRSKRLAGKKGGFVTTGNTSINKMATFTAEQFNALLAQVNQPSARLGSFSNCTARFNGVRDPSKVQGRGVYLGYFNI